ncbi:MAG: hypothetical protein ABIJ20_04470 [Nanoarchaeota archaeon]
MARKSISKVLSKHLENEDYTEFFEVEDLEKLHKLYEEIFK